mgnify:CR=1 FL=1
MKAKKIFKGMTAAAVAAVLAASMVPMTAFAAAPGYDDLIDQAVTMPSTLSNAKYNVYLVASAAHKTGDASGVYEYTLEAGFTGVTNFAVDANKRLTYKNSVLSASTSASDLKELADALETASSSATAVTGGSNLGSGDSLTLAPGYYLVTTTGTQMKSAPMLVSVTNAAKELTAKSSDLTFEKNIVSVKDGQGTVDGTADKHKSAEVAIGSEVEYEIKTNFPSYSDEVVAAVKKDVDPLNITDFVITDDPSSGITLKEIVVKVDGTAVEESAGAYVIDKNVTTGTNGGTGFTITFADPYVVNNQNKSVVVSFKADVNERAASQTAIPNDAILNFDNDYATGGGDGELKDETDIYRTDLIIYKTDEASNPIAGVGFTVYKTNPATDGGVTKGAAIGSERFTDDEGKITITDLPAGTYIISETTVPANYKKADDVTITIEATKDTASNKYTGAYKFTGTDKISDTENDNMKTIVNIKGQELPGTGGMGTIIFTVAGAGVVLVAGIMLIVYMKKRKIEE